jgi:hypothetical protein
MDFVKKEWQFRDIISENELNRMEDGIEEGITKAEQAQQTATDAQTNLDNHVSAITGVHGATSAATPNAIVQRDAAGRAKFAAPVASDDAARKQDVDAVDSAAMKKVADSDLDMNARSIRNLLTLHLRNATPLTISNGAITVTQTYHSVDTEGGAPTDDLDTINGGNVGDILVLRGVTGARKVTVRHGVGNIYTCDGQDVTIDTGNLSIMMLLKMSATQWVVVGNPGIKRTGDAMRGPLSMGGYRITDLAAPTNANDAARKAEVDAITTEKINTTAYRPATEDGSTYPIGVTSFAVTNGLSDGWPQDAGVVSTTRLSDYRCLQIFMASATGSHNGRVYVRSWRIDIGWSNWRRQWDDREMGAGSGLDADLLHGRQPSTSATANTIVQRDSSGRAKFAAPAASDDAARKAEVDAHANRTDNPHAVTKSQVGLGNVQNYGIASQAQAEAGSANNVYMTPLRTKQAIDQFVPIETGTWTPELRFGGQNTGISYASRRGQYTRIANVVHWTFEISLSSKGSASGIATIAGLPFSKGVGFDPHAVGNASNISVPSGQWLSSYIASTSVYLTTNNGVLITSAEFANNSLLRASGFYFI